MDLEKYSYLWAKDSGWVLTFHGDKYRILRYDDEKGQLASPSFQLFENDDLYEAVVNKMKSEGVKILTEHEAKELYNRWDTKQKEHHEKSEKLIEQALKNNQLIKNALRELLDNLDEVAEKHSEINDTMVREILSDIILHFFVFDSPTNDAALDNDSDNYYAMFSDEGNEAVHKALVQFLTHPEAKAARQQLAIPEERLVVFQDAEVESSKGNSYDWYFGEVRSLSLR
jgi:hypothetical protein